MSSLRTFDDIMFDLIYRWDKDEVFRYVAVEDHSTAWQLISKNMTRHVGRQQMTAAVHSGWLRLQVLREKAATDLGEVMLEACGDPESLDVKLASLALKERRDGKGVRRG